MPQQEQKDNMDMKSENMNCSMDGQGWECRPLDSAHQRLTISLAGHDVILAENIGSPLQALKPVSGDFGIISKLISDAEQWLKHHKQMLPGLNQGVTMWLEWKKHSFENPIQPEDFFESYLGQDETPGLSVR
jgi:hypothetical protein